MIVQNPDSVTLFFQNPANIHRLKVSQLLRLTDLQTRIDELNAQELNDFNMTNRNIQVGHLRDDMVTIVEGAMVDGRIAHQPTGYNGAVSLSPRHMAHLDGRHSD